jgi:hypothetical protein
MTPPQNAVEPDEISTAQLALQAVLRRDYMRVFSMSKLHAKMIIRPHKNGPRINNCLSKTRQLTRLLPVSLRKKNGGALMIPVHQKIIDKTLTLTYKRTTNLAQAIGSPPGEQSIERLRASPLGLQLAAIAEYAEGYAYQGEGDIRKEILAVIKCLFSDTLQPKRVRCPRQYYQSALGQMVSRAALRFFRQERPGRLIKVAEAAQICGVRRQTIHDWAEDGIFWIIYDDHGTVWIDRNMVENWQKQREQKR